MNKNTHHSLSSLVSALVALATAALALTMTDTASAAVPASAVYEAVETALKVSGRTAVSAAAREAAEKTLREAALRHGADALSTAAKGGVEIIEVAARHGDDVWRLCAHAGPDAVRSLALNADTLLPLARRIGPEVMQLEAAAPGLAARAATVFGDDAMKTLVKLPYKKDLPRLIGLAEKADNPQTARLLLRKCAESGGRVPASLNWKTIAAGGAGAGIIVSSYQVSRGVRDAVTTMAGAFAKALNEAAEAVSDGMRTAAEKFPEWLFALAVLVAFCGLVFVAWRGYRARRSRRTSAAARVNGN